MSYKGITVADILAAIRENRNAFRYWTRKEFPVIAQSHTDNIRDLRIMLLSVRFPENTFPAFSFGEGFTPVIVTEPDTNNEQNAPDSDTVSDSDLAAISDAFVDELVNHVESVTGETVNA